MQDTVLERSSSANVTAAHKVPYQPSRDPLFITPELLQNPYPIYRELREHAPIYRSPWGVWIASRYEEIAHILKDKSFGRGYFYFEGLAERQGAQILQEPIYQCLRNTMVMKDGEEHTRVRNLVANAFTHKRSEEMRPRIQQMVDKMLDKFVGQSEMDLLKDLAFPLPATVTYDLLGIPEQVRADYAERATNGSRVLEPLPLSRQELDAQNAAIAKFDLFFRDMYEERLLRPTEDLVSALIASRIDGDQLSYEEIRDNVEMFFVAGGETTVNTIGNGFLALFRNPAQLQLLRSDLSLMPGAVEEFIRYESSTQITPRQALVDIEICGEQIKRGDTILCLVASANHDPALYRNPDQLDITRTGIKPVSFGGGPHFCIAAQLSRIQAQVAIATALRRFPNMRPKNIDDIQWLDNTIVFRGLKTLPVWL